MSLHKTIITIVAITVWGMSLAAQEAKVPVKVSPSQSYVFLDGVAVRDGNVTLRTTPGEHMIAVYNYGYKGEVRSVTVLEGKNEVQEFNLQPSGDAVSGDFGLLQIEGAGRAAILLNGTAPEYQVGHVDEFNNHIVNFQQLMLLPGKHEVMVTQNGSTLWSGEVQINAGERTILRVPSGERTTQPVANLNGAHPRFKAGTASAAVAVAPVKATLAATPPNINCNETSQLAYSSVDALHTTMKADAEAQKLPSLSGEMPVTPKHTTTYEFAASGPGGLATQQATVNINPVVQATLETTPAEIHYIAVGNNVLVQDTADIKWNIANADNMSITPFGTVMANGEQKVKAEPKATTGAVDETQSYTLTATNVCGGSDTKTAQVRTKGTIDPYVLSVFFPTAYPNKKHPDVGLVASQEQRLITLAGMFPLYAEHVPEGKVVVRGYTDPRGKNKYNLALTERRLALVKDFLIAHGIPTEKITLEPLGESQVLDLATVEKLEAENPFKVSNSTGQVKPRTIRLAYNRRVDIELQPANVQTSRFFPHDVVEAGVLMQRRAPRMEKLTEVQPARVASASGNDAGN